MWIIYTLLIINLLSIPVTLWLFLCQKSEEEEREDIETLFGEK